MPISFIPYTAVYGPLSLPGATCALWLDGADPLGNNSVPANGATVSTWVDKSRNGRNATQVGGSLTYSSSLQGITFDGGSSSYYSVPSGTFPTGNTFYSFFLIVRTSLPADKYSHMFSSGTPVGGQAINMALYPNGLVETGWWTTNIQSAPGIVTANTTIMLGTTYNSTGLFLYGNGSTIASSTILGSRNSAASLGYVGAAPEAVNSTQRFIGTMFEAILFSGALTTPQQQSIEGYLAQKWGLTSQLPAGHPGLTQTLYNGKVYQPQISLKPAPYANYYPLSLAGCALWLDAADPAGTGTPPANGSTVSTWADKSGNNVILNTVGTPTYNSTQYGKGGVIFNGSSYFQNTTFSFPLATRAIFIVANGSSGNTGILAMTYTAVDYSSLNSLVYVTSGNKVITLTEYYPAGFNVSFTSPVEPVITSDSANGTTVSYFGNGTLVQSLTFTPTTSTGIIIGARNDAGGVWVNKLLTGNINEIILYKTTLTTNQRQQVEGYLAWKWGIQSSFISHPYSSAPPVQYTRGAILPPPTLNATGSASYANTAYYNVSPQAWNYNWRPYLQSLAAANSSGVTVTFSTSSVTGSGGGYYGGVLAPNGKIYCIQLGTAIGVIDPVLNNITSFETSTSSYAGGVLAPNGKIYCIPFNAISIGVIDPLTNTFTTFGSVTGTGAGNLAYNGGVLAPNGNIYAIPRNATSVGVIDPVANTFTTFGTTPGNNAYNGGVLAPNGKIYCIPFSATSVGVIDPATNTFTTFGTAPGSTAYTGGVLAPNGKIYCIPSSSTSVGVIDPVANTFSSVSVSGTAPGGGAYAGGVLAPNGKIYCISHNSGNIGIIDPVANTFTTFGSAPGGQAYIGAILAPNGNIYFIPYGTSSVGVISFAGLKQLPSSNYCLSAYTNKY